MEKGYHKIGRFVNYNFMVNYESSKKTDNERRKEKGHGERDGDDCNAVYGVVCMDEGGVMKQKIELTIDPEFESLIPPLSDEEFNQLKENILEAGECYDPIMTWNHIIVDGHNRWKIIQENPDIHYETTEMIFFSRNDVMAWMIRNQLGRRNLTAFARTELSLKLKPILAEEAEKRMKAGKADPVPNLAQGKVRDEIAKAAQVSHGTVSKVEKILDKAPEEVKEQLRKGEVSINKAYNEIREAEQPKPIAPVEQQTFTVDDLVREISTNADTFISILRTTLAERNTLYTESNDKEKVYKAVRNITAKLNEIETLLM